MGISERFSRVEMGFAFAFSVVFRLEIGSIMIWVVLSLPSALLSWKDSRRVLFL